MYQRLKERGRAASDHYAGQKDYFFLTPASLTLLRALEPLIKEHCRGRVLDAGCGRGAYHDLLLQYADDYLGIDIGTSKATSVLGNIQQLPLADRSFDTVFCSQVLEHLPEPRLTLNEFRRILKPGGALILSVPHLSWMHNEPHDYYRYTCHGLNFLVEQAGFPPGTIQPAGGLLSLLGHIPSTLAVNLTFGSGGLHAAAMILNRLWVRMIAAVDEQVEKKKIYALNYVGVWRTG